MRSFRQRAMDCRESVLSVYRRLGFRGDDLAVLSALTIGYKEELSEDIRDPFVSLDLCLFYRAVCFSSPVSSYVFSVCFGEVVRAN